MKRAAWLGEFFLVITCIGIGLYYLTYQLPLISPTYDEGFSYLQNGEYLAKNLRWDRPYILLHPPLAYYLHGISSLIFPTYNPDERLLIARLSMVPLYVVFSGLLYLVVRRRFGRFAALTALILYLFSPEILSHARFITPDHLLALTIFTTLLSFYSFLKKQSVFTVISCGVSLGLTLLTKYNGLLLLPLMVGTGLVYALRRGVEFKKVAAGLCTIFTLALFLLHAGYFFRESGRLPEKFVSPQIKKLSTFSVVNKLFLLLPRAYLEGADFQMYESSKGVWWGYFAGKYYVSGLWYFYPAVFVIKTPLPLLALLTISLVWWIRRKTGRTLLGHLILLTVGWFFFYFIFFNKLIIGLRYLLMVYPLLFLFIAYWVGSIRFLPQKKRLVKQGVIIVLLAWYVWGSVKIAPFYLAFANEVVGGPRQLWKYVADSNLDWDQDQTFFELYRRQHPEITAVNPRKPTAGIIAVNVNEMNLYYFHEYQWLRDLKIEPIDQVGFTWLIFKIDASDINKY